MKKVFWTARVLSVQEHHERRLKQRWIILLWLLSIASLYFGFIDTQ
jgi:hypothetical protein